MRDNSGVAVLVPDLMASGLADRTNLFSLIRIEFATPASMPRWKMSCCDEDVVANQLNLAAEFLVTSSTVPVVSEKPSSSDTMGYCAPVSQNFTMSSLDVALVRLLEDVFFFALS